MALAYFSNLTELELVGGSFYHHKVAEMLEIKGFQLKSLTLTSMKEIDYKGLLNLLSIKGLYTVVLFETCKRPMPNYFSI